MKEDLIVLFDQNRPLSNLKNANLRDRTLFNIGDAAKKVKKDLSVPSLDEAYAGIRLLDADEDEDDVMSLTYTREQLEKVCKDLFQEFRTFFKGFLESVWLEGKMNVGGDGGRYGGSMRSGWWWYAYAANPGDFGGGVEGSQAFDILL